MSFSLSFYLNLFGGMSCHETFTSSYETRVMYPVELLSLCLLYCKLHLKLLIHSQSVRFVLPHKLRLSLHTCFRAVRSFSLKFSNFLQILPQVTPESNSLSRNSSSHSMTQNSPFFLDLLLPTYLSTVLPFTRKTRLF